MLPGIPGEEVLRDIRKKGNTPVIILTAKDTIDDKVEFLRGGADDYVTKPFVRISLSTSSPGIPGSIKSRSITEYLSPCKIILASVPENACVHIYPSFSNASFKSPLIFTSSMLWIK